MDTTPLLWVGVVIGSGALVVAIWQAVRYFRNHDGED